MERELDTCAILTELARLFDAEQSGTGIWAVQEVADNHGLHFYYNDQGLAVISTERLAPSEEDFDEDE